MSENAQTIEDVAFASQFLHGSDIRDRHNELNIIVLVSGLALHRVRYQRY